PIALAAMLDALGDRRSGRAGAWLRSDAPVPSRAVRVTAVAASAVVTLVLGSSMPLADLVRPQRWELTWRAQPAQEALEAVPDGSVLAVDITLLAPAVPDHEVQWLHGPNQRVPDCVLADEYSFSWSSRPSPDIAVWAQQRWGAEYSTTYDEGGFSVACRPEAAAAGDSVDAHLAGAACRGAHLGLSPLRAGGFYPQPPRRVALGGQRQAQDAGDGLIGGLGWHPWQSARDARQ